METDATGTNRDVYVGKVVIRNGSGVVIDTQKLDAFDDYGIPLASSRTLPNPASVWDELLSAHTISGSAGNKLTTLKNPSLIIDGVIIV